MGANSGIQWTHHSFNPWRGCTHVSPGCEHCYAESLGHRFPATHGTWGAGGQRVIASEGYWRQPEAWDRAAAAAGERHRVFCASLADVFEDRPELVEPRKRLFDLIYRTPNLDWLVLTKRPENVRMLVPSGWMVEPGNLLCDRCGASASLPTGMTCPEHDPRMTGWPPNVWLGVSVEDQRRADERIPLLLDTPAAVRFLSMEPLLGPVDLRDVTYDAGAAFPETRLDALTGYIRGPMISRYIRPGSPPPTSIDWVIVGGESGRGARSMDIAWARTIVGQCRDAGVPVFVKQLGALPAWEGSVDLGPLLSMRDRKGGDPAEWPEDLRVRQFPSWATTEGVYRG